jgi:hypothetical protein
MTHWYVEERRFGNERPINPLILDCPAEGIRDGWENTEALHAKEDNVSDRNEENTAFR